jgi:hypothetical protein
LGVGILGVGILGVGILGVGIWGDPLTLVCFSFIFDKEKRRSDSGGPGEDKKECIFTWTWMMISECTAKHNYGILPQSTQAHMTDPHPPKEKNNHP